VRREAAGLEAGILQLLVQCAAFEPSDPKRRSAVRYTADGGAFFQEPHCDRRR
jgi:hypothetical protein